MCNPGITQEAMKCNRIQTKQNRPGSRMYSTWLCFATSRLERTSWSLKMEQSVSRLLPVNTHTVCTVSSSRARLENLGGVFRQCVLLIHCDV